MTLGKLIGRAYIYGHSLVGDVSLFKLIGSKVCPVIAVA